MPKTIFVVDDNNMNLIVVKDALKDRYRVMTVLSADKMFSLLEKLTPDLILLDILMPEMDGYEAVKLLKSSSAHANIPVIFLTSTLDDSIKEHGRQLGVLDFVLKPFEKDELLEKIERGLG